MIRVDKITHPAAFAALEPIWNSVLEASASNTLTLTYEWLSTWWHVFNDHRELYILLVRDDEAVIGLAPMLKRRVQQYGLLSLRRLEFLATGEDEADELCSDYLDFICVRGREEEALGAILQTLHADADWDEMWLPEMSAQSVNLPLLKTFCARQETHTEARGEALTLYLPLNQSWENLLQNTGSDFRRRIRQDRKRFAEYGGEIRRIDTEDGFAAAFEQLITLHQARWTGRQRPGVFASQRFTTFHRQFAKLAMRRGWLKVYLALKDGQAFAAIYNFIYNNKMHYYQSGVRIEASGLRSPGVLLQSFAIEDAIHLGCSEYDFLKSAAGSYKFKWHPQTRALVNLRVSRTHAKAALYNTTAKVIGGLRGFKRSLKNRAAI